ncbi:MAG: peptidylprolyl isomerase [Bacteroidota bacterium]
MLNILRTGLLGCFLLVSTYSFAQQTSSADKIIVVVGKRIILKSELGVQAAQMRAQEGATEVVSDSIYCNLLQGLIVQKILEEQAERDSVVVSEEEVEGTLDNRIRYFTQMYGSKEKMEQATGKTIYQLKEENREIFKGQLLAEKVQNTLLQSVKITPAEIKAFFDKIPKDSLPFFPATVEVGQIVIAPPVSPELDELARKDLEDIRKQIVVDGKSFETMASFYSEDPGSRDNGGDLGTMGRNDFVPEFAAAAFKLQNGEVSQVIKTKFGYHIIQMVERKGDQAHLRHILKRPKLTSADFQKSLTKLDSVRADLITGKITFQEAVGKYATDDASKRNGGMITDPTTGSTALEIDKLDPSMALMVDSIKVGAFSQPQIFADASVGERSCRIVYMKGRTEPHKANLKDDYSKIQQIALSQKQGKKLEQWLKDKLPTYYIKIDPEYQNCNGFKMWLTESSFK